MDKGDRRVSFTIAADQRWADALMRRLQAPSAADSRPGVFEGGVLSPFPSAVCHPTAHPVSRQAAVFLSKGPFPICKGPVASVTTNQTVLYQALSWPKTQLTSSQTEPLAPLPWALVVEFLEPNGCGGISSCLPLQLVYSQFSDFPSLCAQICEIYANNMLAKGCPYLKTHT